MMKRKVMGSRGVTKDVISNGLVFRIKRFRKNASIMFN